MPRYYFALINSRGVIADPDGTELPDEAAAQTHAEGVANELMRHREAATRSWRLSVHDDRHRVLFEVPFIRLDQTLQHLAPYLRTSIENVILGKVRLDDAVRDVRRSMTQLRCTMARAGGESHLVPVVLDGTADRPPVTPAVR